MYNVPHLTSSIYTVFSFSLKKSKSPLRWCLVQCVCYVWIHNVECTWTFSIIVDLPAYCLKRYTYGTRVVFVKSWMKVKKQWNEVVSNHITPSPCTRLILREASSRMELASSSWVGVSNPTRLKYILFWSRREAMRWHKRQRIKENYYNYHFSWYVYLVEEPKVVVVVLNKSLVS